MIIALHKGGLRSKDIVAALGTTRNAVDPVLSRYRKAKEKRTRSTDVILELYVSPREPSRLVVRGSARGRRRRGYWSSCSASICPGRHRAEVVEYRAEQFAAKLGDRLRGLAVTTHVTTGLDGQLDRASDVGVTPRA